MQVSQWMRKYFYYFLLLVTSTVGGRVLTLVWYFVLVSDVPTGVTNVTLHGTIDMIHIKCKCPATKQKLRMSRYEKFQNSKYIFRVISWVAQKMRTFQ